MNQNQVEILVDIGVGPPTYSLSFVKAFLAFFPLVRSAPFLLDMSCGILGTDDSGEATDIDWMNSDLDARVYAEVHGSGFCSLPGGNYERYVGIGRLNGGSFFLG